MQALSKDVDLTINVLLNEITVLKQTLKDEKLKKKIMTLYDCAKDVQSVIKYELEFEQPDHFTVSECDQSLYSSTQTHDIIQNLDNIICKENYDIDFPDKLHTLQSKELDTHGCYNFSTDGSESALCVQMATAEMLDATQINGKYTHTIFIDTETMQLKNLTDKFRKDEHINNMHEFVNKKFYYTVTNFYNQYLYKFNKRKTYYICDDKKLYEIVNNELVPGIYGKHLQLWIATNI